jgi:bifunctional DNA-binding transcriptional regulator/antitoxin component of YhaV-PrlF toxin-antitoxin module
MEPTPYTQTNRIGKRGAWIVPARLRRQYGLEEGSLVIAEPRPDGILIKPAAASSLLPASGTSGNPWNDWFGLMEQISATAKEISDARQEGQR